MSAGDVPSVGGHPQEATTDDAKESNREGNTSSKMTPGCMMHDPLPKWLFWPLNSKFPLVPGPRKVRFFTTNLGEKIVQSFPELEFDLSDPNVYQTPTKYEPLHDPHLHKWFENKVVRDHLMKKGLINEDGKVLCDLAEFNKYRAYLDRVYRQMERKEKEEGAFSGQLRSTCTCREKPLIIYPGDRQEHFHHLRAKVAKRRHLEKAAAELGLSIHDPRLEDKVIENYRLKAAKERNKLWREMREKAARKMQTKQKLDEARIQKHIADEEARRVMMKLQLEKLQAEQERTQEEQFETRLQEVKQKHIEDQQMRIDKLKTRLADFDVRADLYSLQKQMELQQRREKLEKEWEKRRQFQLTGLLSEQVKQAQLEKERSDRVEERRKVAQQKHASMQRKLTEKSRKERLARDEEFRRVFNLGENSSLPPVENATGDVVTDGGATTSLLRFMERMDRDQRLKDKPDDFIDFSTRYMGPVHPDTVRIYTCSPVPDLERPEVKSKPKTPDVQVQSPGNNAAPAAQEADAGEAVGNAEEGTTRTLGRSAQPAGHQEQNTSPTRNPRKQKSSSVPSSPRKQKPESGKTFKEQKTSQPERNKQQKFSPKNSKETKSSRSPRKWRSSSLESLKKSMSSTKNPTTRKSRAGSPPLNLNSSARSTRKQNSLSDGIFQQQQTSAAASFRRTKLSTHKRLKSPGPNKTKPQSPRKSKSPSPRKTKVLSPRKRKQRTFGFEEKRKTSPERNSAKQKSPRRSPRKEKISPSTSSRGKEQRKEGESAQTSVLKLSGQSAKHLHTRKRHASGKREAKAVEDRTVPLSFPKLGEKRFLLPKSPGKQANGAALLKSVSSREKSGGQEPDVNNKKVPSPRKSAGKDGQRKAHKELKSSSPEHVVNKRIKSPKKERKVIVVETKSKDSQAKDDTANIDETLDQTKDSDYQSENEVEVSNELVDEESRLLTGSDPVGEAQDLNADVFAHQEAQMTGTTSGTTSETPASETSSTVIEVASLLSAEILTNLRDVVAKQTPSARNVVEKAVLSVAQKLEIQLSDVSYLQQAALEYEAENTGTDAKWSVTLFLKALLEAAARQTGTLQSEDQSSSHTLQKPISKLPVSDPEKVKNLNTGEQAVRKSVSSPQISFSNFGLVKDQNQGGGMRSAENSAPELNQLEEVGQGQENAAVSHKKPSILAKLLGVLKRSFHSEAKLKKSVDEDTTVEDSLEGDDLHDKASQEVVTAILTDLTHDASAEALVTEVLEDVANEEAKVCTEILEKEANLELVTEVSNDLAWTEEETAEVTPDEKVGEAMLHGVEEDSAGEEQEITKVSAEDKASEVRAKSLEKVANTIPEEEKTTEVTSDKKVSEAMLHGVVENTTGEEQEIAKVSVEDKACEVGAKSLESVHKTIQVEETTQIMEKQSGEISRLIGEIISAKDIMDEVVAHESALNGGEDPSRPVSETSLIAEIVGETMGQVLLEVQLLDSEEKTKTLEEWRPESADVRSVIDKILTESSASLESAVKNTASSSAYLLEPSSALSIIATSYKSVSDVNVSAIDLNEKAKEYPVHFAVLRSVADKLGSFLEGGDNEEGSVVTRPRSESHGPIVKLTSKEFLNTAANKYKRWVKEKPEHCNMSSAHEHVLKQTLLTTIDATRKERMPPPDVLEPVSTVVASYLNAQSVSPIAEGPSQDYTPLSNYKDMEADGTRIETPLLIDILVAEILHKVKPETEVFKHQAAGVITEIFRPTTGNDIDEVIWALMNGRRNSETSIALNQNNFADSSNHDLDPTVVHTDSSSEEDELSAIGEVAAANIPFEPMYGDHPLGLNRDEASSALVAVSVMEPEQIKCGTDLAERNSITDLVHPDVSHLKEYLSPEGDPVTEDSAIKHLSEVSTQFWRRSHPPFSLASQRSTEEIDKNTLRRGSVPVSQIPEESDHWSDSEEGEEEIETESKSRSRSQSLGAHLTKIAKVTDPCLLPMAENTKLPTRSPGNAAENIKSSTTERSHDKELRAEMSPDNGFPSSSSRQVETSEDEAEVPPEDPELIEMSTKREKRAREREAERQRQRHMMDGSQKTSTNEVAQRAVFDAVGSSLRPRPSSGYKSDRVEPFPEDELRRQVEELLSRKQMQEECVSTVPDKASTSQQTTTDTNSLPEGAKKKKFVPKFSVLKTDIDHKVVQSDENIQSLGAEPGTEQPQSNSPTAATAQNSEIRTTNSPSRKVSKELEKILSRSKLTRKSSNNESNNNNASLPELAGLEGTSDSVDYPLSPSSFISQNSTGDGSLKRLRIGSTTLTTVTKSLQDQNK